MNHYALLGSHLTNAFNGTKLGYPFEHIRGNSYETFPRKFFLMFYCQLFSEEWNAFLFGFANQQSNGK